MHLVSKPFTTVLEPLTSQIYESTAWLQMQWSEIIPLQWHASATSIVFSDSTRCYSRGNALTRPQRRGKRCTECRPDPLSSVAQSKHSNANRVNTLHTSVGKLFIFHWFAGFFALRSRYSRNCKKRSLKSLSKRKRKALYKKAELKFRNESKIK